MRATAIARLFTKMGADSLLDTRRAGASAPRGTRSAARRIERLLLVVAFASLGYWGWNTAATAVSQAYDSYRLDARIAERMGSVRIDSTPLPPSPPPNEGELVGRLEIPAVDLLAIVREGDGVPTLRRAIGRVAGTARPGERGNLGLAGHRDTLFRELEGVRPGQRVRLVTVHGTFDYEVEWTRVVDPDDVWVLDHTAVPSLTLVTCFPFTYLGNAPQRFVVRARLLDPVL